MLPSRALWDRIFWLRPTAERSRFLRYKVCAWWVIKRNVRSSAAASAREKGRFSPPPPPPPSSSSSSVRREHSGEWCVCQFMSGHNRWRHTVTHHSQPTSITMAPSSPSPRREIILAVTVGGPDGRPAGTCWPTSRHHQPGDQWLDADTFHTIPQFTFIHSVTLATDPYTSSTAIP